MSEPIRLWRQERVDEGGVKYARFVYSPHEGTSEWTTVDLPMAAISRSEYDALVAEAADARTLRAERDSLVKERDVAVREQEAWRLAYVSQARQQEAATARAEKAERERDDARAALDAQIATVLAAHLDAPTDDDRRGEDGGA